MYTTHNGPLMSWDSEKDILHSGGDDDNRKI